MLKQGDVLVSLDGGRSVVILFTLAKVSVEFGSRGIFILTVYGL